MKTRKAVVSFVTLILFLILALAVCQRKSKKTKNTKKTHSLAKSPEQLTVYGYMGCPYTVKQLDLLKNNNISHKFVATDTSAGAKEFMSLMGGQKSGVPVTLNNETGKLSQGFTPLTEL
jgi:glutaredoxin